jgi:hypothetical protein
MVKARTLTSVIPHPVEHAAGCGMNGNAAAEEHRDAESESQRGNRADRSREAELGRKAWGDHLRREEA